MCVCVLQREKLLMALEKKIHRGMCLVWQEKKTKKEREAREKKRRESDWEGHMGLAHATSNLCRMGWARIASSLGFSYWGAKPTCD